MGGAASAIDIDASTRERVDEAFKNIDDNFSGDIDICELERYVNCSNLNDKSSTKLAKTWFEVINANGDSVVRE
jgi:Ca2+-binding EF-hand superfamily protein